MVTLAEIDAVHEQLGKADTLDAYCHALADLGVTGYDSYVFDGHTVFHLNSGDDLVTPAHHDLVEVATEPDHAAVHTVLGRAEAGELGYVEMSELLGAAGLERWSVDTRQLVMTYVDVHGEAALVEHLST